MSVVIPDEILLATGMSETELRQEIAISNRISRLCAAPERPRPPRRARHLAEGRPRPAGNRGRPCGPRPDVRVRRPYREASANFPDVRRDAAKDWIKSRLAGRLSSMKTLTVELPDRVAESLEGLVEAGWFRDEAEVVRLALVEFLNRHRLQLAEQFQREDISWALQQKTKPE